MRSEILKNEDTNSIKEMWRYCFGDTDDFTEWFFEDKYDPSNTLGIRRDGHVISNLQMVPYTMSCRNTDIPSAYIVGVATLPEARNHGHMGVLIQDALRVMRERGILLSPLYPFQYGFYRKYGWEVCYNQLQYNLPLQKLSVFKGKKGYFRAIHWESDVPLITESYDRFMEGYTGYIKRTPEDWISRGREHRLDGGYGYLAIEGDQPTGYLLYHLKENILEVDEMVYTSDEVKYQWLSFIHSHSSQVERCSWISPVDDGTYLTMEDARGSILMNPSAMLRIVDVEALLSLLPVPKGIEGCMDIKITDDYAPWNQKVFSIHACKGKLEIQPLDTQEWDLELPIGVFTQIILGFITPSQVAAMGKSTVRSWDALFFLESLFPIQKPFLYEMY